VSPAPRLGPRRRYWQRPFEQLLEQHWEPVVQPKLPLWMHPQWPALHWFEQHPAALRQKVPSARQAWHVPNEQFPEQHGACVSPHPAPVAAQPAAPHVPPLQSLWQHSLALEHVSPSFWQAAPLELEVLDVEVLEVLDVEVLDVEALDVEALDVEVLDVEVLDVEVLDVEELDVEELDVEVLDVEVAPVLLDVVPPALLVAVLLVLPLPELLVLALLLPVSPPFPEDEVAAVVPDPPSDPVANRLVSTPPHPVARVAAPAGARNRAERTAAKREVGVMTARPGYADRRLRVERIARKHLDGRPALGKDAAPSCPPDACARLSQILAPGPLPW
jgi:hypothetical protein